MEFYTCQYGIYVLLLQLSKCLKINFSNGNKRNHQVFKDFVGEDIDRWAFPVKGSWGKATTKDSDRWKKKFDDDSVSYFSEMLKALNSGIQSYVKDHNSNILLFVNGYKIEAIAKEISDFENNNTITRTDSHDYWGIIDDHFIDRLKSATVLYADGDNSIKTSNHRNVTNFYCSARKVIDVFPDNAFEGGLKYAEDLTIVTLLLTGHVELAVKIEAEIEFACRNYTEPRLNTDSNKPGFDKRYNAGKLAGKKFTQ